MPKLTDTQIAGLKARAKRYEVFDEGGRALAVRVGKSGKKSFVFLYHFGGRLRRLTLGTYPKMRLADANIALGRARKQLEEGNDPAAQMLAARGAERSAETIEQLCDDYIERYAKPNKRSAAEDERLLMREVLPHWRGKKAKDIHRRDVTRLLDGIVDRGSPVTANRTLAVIRRMFNFAVDRGVIEQCPCSRMRAPHKEKPRERALQREEIKAFWDAIAAAPIEHNLRQVIRLLLVTGQRKSEIVGLQKREIDGATKIWTLPSIRQKKDKERLIPLSPLALELIGSAKPYDPKYLRKRSATAAGETPKSSPFIFPSSRLKGGPYNGRSIDHVMRDLFVARDRSKQRREKATGKGTERDAKISGPSLKDFAPFTPHDLRRTVATRMRELGISRDDVKLVLGHQDQSVTGRVYDKYEGLAEKRRALDLWAKRLSAIIAGEPDASNIVEMPARGGI